MKKIFFFLLLVVLSSCAKDPDMSGFNFTWDFVAYDPGLTRVVSVYNNNILVRGNFPIYPNGNFAYDSILKYIESKVPSINLSNHVFIDISMLDNVEKAEWPQLKQELAAYSLADTAIPSDWPPYKIGYTATLLGTTVSNHPGHFLWWPIEGFNPAMSWDQKIGQFFTNNGYAGQKGGYNFDGLVDRLDSLLKDESYPKIIYYHCTWGKDRTGALTFGWLVKHNNLSKDSAKATVDSVAAPNDHYTGMINDYWTWLHP
jgi:hypothetical protein